MAELFKYKSVNKYLYDSLKKKYLYFSKPSELDDIFECKIAPNFDGTTDNEIEAWIKLQKDNNAKDFFYENINDVKMAIANGQLEEHYTNNSNLLDHYHILSLCKEKDNQKLWSLYANTYKGVCIGYKTDQIATDIYELKIENLKKNYKGITTPIANIDYRPGSCIATLKATDYKNEGQFSYNWINEKFFERQSNGTVILKYDGKANNNDVPQIFEKFLNSKSTIWSEQEEFRCFYNDMNIGMSKIYYPDETLSRIVFGYKTKKRYMKKIYKLVNKYYSTSVIFEVAKPDYKTRTITFDTYQP